MIETMPEQQIIANLLELVRDMGCVIRQLDEEGDFSHFWQNDGGYVPDGRYKAGLEFERTHGVVGSNGEPFSRDTPMGGKEGQQ